MILPMLIVLGGVFHLGIHGDGRFAQGAGVADGNCGAGSRSPGTLWTHGAFIVLTVIGFAVISLTRPGDRLPGTVLRRRRVRSSGCSGWCGW